MTGSLGIISEAIHSLIDLFATIITYFAIKFGDMPADEDHHYGHEKIESLASLVETGLLFATSVWIMYECAHRLMGAPMEIEITWYAIAIIVISIVVDFFRSKNLMKVAKATHSQALEADALHFSSDMWSSGAVLIGLIGVYLGFAWADTLSAMVVSLMILKAGWSLGKQAVEVLIDTAPKGSEERIREIVAQVVKKTTIGSVRVRTFEGTTLAVELEIFLPGSTELRKAVAIKKKIREKVQETYRKAHVFVYADVEE
jgi:cation diffusion facilitator family transporter